MGDIAGRPDDNPYVGGGMHKNPRQADLHGRAERRALARDYGMPNRNSATKRKRKKRR